MHILHVHCSPVQCFILFSKHASDAFCFILSSKGYSKEQIRWMIKILRYIHKKDTTRTNDNLIGKTTRIFLLHVAFIFDFM